MGLEVGQVYLIREGTPFERLVRLLAPPVSDDDDEEWYVENVMRVWSKEQVMADDLRSGRLLNAMEVLAWAAK